MILTSNNEADHKSTPGQDPKILAWGLLEESLALFPRSQQLVRQADRGTASARDSRQRVAEERVAVVNVDLRDEVAVAERRNPVFQLINLETVFHRGHLHLTTGKRSKLQNQES